MIDLYDEVINNFDRNIKKEIETEGDITKRLKKKIDEYIKDNIVTDLIKKSDNKFIYTYRDLVKKWNYNLTFVARHAQRHKVNRRNIE